MTSADLGFRFGTPRRVASPAGTAVLDPALEELKRRQARLERDQEAAQRRLARVEGASQVLAENLSAKIQPEAAQAAQELEKRLQIQFESLETRLQELSSKLRREATDSAASAATATRRVEGHEATLRQHVTSQDFHAKRLDDALIGLAAERSSLSTEAQALDARLGKVEAILRTGGALVEEVPPAPSTVSQAAGSRAIAAQLANRLEAVENRLLRQEESSKAATQTVGDELAARLESLENRLQHQASQAAGSGAIAADVAQLAHRLETAENQLLQQEEQSGKADDARQKAGEELSARLESFANRLQHQASQAAGSGAIAADVSQFANRLETAENRLLRQEEQSGRQTAGEELTVRLESLENRLHHQEDAAQSQLLELGSHAECVREAASRADGVAAAGLVAMESSAQRLSVVERSILELKVHLAQPASTQRLEQLQDALEQLGQKLDPLTSTVSTAAASEAEAIAAVDSRLLELQAAMSLLREPEPGLQHHASSNVASMHGSFEDAASPLQEGLRRLEERISACESAQGSMPGSNAMFAQDLQEVVGKLTALGDVTRLVRALAEGQQQLDTRLKAMEDALER